MSDKKSAQLAEADTGLHNEAESKTEPTVKKVHAFLDTDYFLHYEQIQNTDWRSFLQSEEVCLEISSMVTDQLDQHKDQHPVRSLRERARSSLHNLEQMFSQDNIAPVSDGVTAEFIGKSPMLDYAQYALDWHSEDDRILADIIAFQQARPASLVVLVAGDRGFRMKARSRKIRALDPPIHKRLPPVLDPIEKENRELKRRLVELESQMPGLDVTFQGGYKHQTFTLTARTAFDDRAVHSAVEKIRASFPTMEFPVRERRTNSTEKFSLEDVEGQSFVVRPALPEDEAYVEIRGKERRITREGMREYNQRLAKFSEDYAEYVKELGQYRKQRRRMLELKFEVSNCGSCPSEDTDVFFTLPLRFHLGKEDWLDAAPKRPVIPSVPEIRSAGGIFISELNPPLDANFLTSSLLGSRPTLDDLTAPVIHRTVQDYRVRYSLGKLKHAQTELLDPLYVLFFSDGDIFNFGIHFEIHADNLVQPVGGDLHVVVSDDAQEDREWILSIPTPLEPKK